MALLPASPDSWLFTQDIRNMLQGLSNVARIRIFPEACQTQSCLGPTPDPLSWSIGASITRHHRLGSLKTTEVYFSRFWEAQDQGANMVSC